MLVKVIKGRFFDGQLRETGEEFEYAGEKIPGCLSPVEPTDTAKETKPASKRGKEVSMDMEVI